MNSTKIGDTVQTITRQYASGDAACRAGDIAEAMATVDGISRAQTVDAIVSYLCLAGFVYDEADHLRASLQASL